MLVDHKTCKRLVIYFIYDRDGIVDRYILYMLEDLKKNAQDLSIVVNGTLRPEEKDKLYPYTQDILERENKGMDVWAYKEAMEQYGWEKLSQYDEVILMNYTMMGPVYPFAEMFEAMSSRDLDFWGITKFHQTDFDPFGTMEWGYIPEHIQSHFIAVRKSMIQSAAFQKYWDEMPMIKDYLMSVGYHEAGFTKRFADQGFKWDVYINTDDLEGYTYHPVIGASVIMIRDKRCPIFKRRSFMQEFKVVMSENCGQEAYELYEYLDKHTDYDMDLFWENILRLENMADLKKNLQLNYFLPTDQSSFTDEQLKSKKLALFIHLYFIDLMDECFHYASNMPPHTDVYITTDKEEKKKLIEEKFADLPCGKLTVIVVGNKGRDVGPFLVEAAKFINDYDYICKVHDKKVQQLKPRTIGASFAYRCFENMLCSKDYVKNIVKTFEENKHLGMLMPPPPNHADYYITLGLEWGLNFANTKKLAEELGIRVNINEKKEPIAPLGGVFWFRPEALKSLFARTWTYDDFDPEPIAEDGALVHAIERVYGLCVQHEGYYPAWLMTERCGGMEVTNLHYMLRTLNDAIFYHGNGAGSHNKVSLDLVANLDELRAYRGVCDLAGKPVNNVGKLYVCRKDGAFSEEDSEISINEERATEFTYQYSGLEKYGEITALRFDPSDQTGISIQKLLVTIKSTDGNEVSYDALTDAEATSPNAVKINGQMLFMGEDPQIMLPLKGVSNVAAITVDVSMKYQIDTESINEMNKMVRRGEKVSKMKIW